MKEIIAKCLPTYETVTLLGEGLYGSVYLVRDRFKQRAVKVVPLLVERSLSCRTAGDLDSKVSQDFHAVRQYYEQIKGEGVVEIYDFHLVDKTVSDSEAKAYLVILMAYCQANLHNYVLDHFPLPCRKSCEMLLQLAAVLKRLAGRHHAGFLVTDLKPTNLLIDGEERIVVADLGGIKRMNSFSATASAQFSPNWSAPEMVLRGERPTAASMVYAFGLVAFYMLEGRLPHEKSDFIARIHELQEEGLDFKRADADARLIHLIAACLEFEPSKRVGSFEEIIQELAACMDRSPQSISAADEKPPPAAGAVIRERPVPDAPGGGTSTPGEPRPGTTWRENVSGIVFVWVPGGTFRMGCDPRDREAFANEKACGDILVEGFWMGKYPVTQAQWVRVMGSNPSRFEGDPNHPVEHVTWHDVVEFVRRLSHLTHGKYRFALPSEAQWEFAARSGGREEKYAGGNDIDRFAWYQGNSGYTTHPVGTREPNGLGIYDMCGNVMEWCSDAYEEKRPAATDLAARGRLAEEDLHRVGRGGSWNLEARRCRTTTRKGIPARLRYSNLGFRVVRLAPQERS